MKFLYIPGYRYPASLDEPIAGGDLRYSFNLSRALARKGHEVHVISRWNRGDQEEALFDGVHIHRYKSEFQRIFSTSFDISVRRSGLFSRLRKNADLLICNSALSLELLKRNSVPDLYICSGLEDVKNYRFTAKETLAFLGIMLLRDPCKRLTWRRSRFVNTTAEAEDRTLLRWGVDAQRVTTVGPGVERSRYRAYAEEEVRSLRDELLAGGRPASRIILCVGRFTPAKGQLETLQAFQALRARVEGVRLLLVGVQLSHSPDYYRQVKESIRTLRLEKDVVIRENVREEELPKYYAAAYISSVFSINYDPLPTVIIESMSCGTPVVSSYYQTREQMITDGESGLFVEPGNTDQWVEAMERLLLDQDLYREIQQGGLKAIEMAFDIDDVAQRYVEMIGRPRAQTGRGAQS